jgi:hypothetical protein
MLNPNQFKNLFPLIKFLPLNLLHKINLNQNPYLQPSQNHPFPISQIPNPQNKNKNNPPPTTAHNKCPQALQIQPEKLANNQNVRQQQSQSHHRLGRIKV